MGEFLKELELVEGRNTGVPVIVNAMRHNGSPDPVFSTPENRDWLSVTLPVHSAFSVTSEKVAPKVAPIKTDVNGKNGLNSLVYTDFEELTMIKSALKAALKVALIKKGDKVVDRMARLVQMILRDRTVTIVKLVDLLGEARRTIQGDVGILKKIAVLDRVGPLNGGEWKVVLKY